MKAQVSHGGFIQFYWYGYDQYLPAIIEGLKLIEDQEILSLLKKVENEIQQNMKALLNFYEVQNFDGAYKKFPPFIQFNKEYMQRHQGTMQKIEAYARNNTEPFACFEHPILYFMTYRSC